MKTTLERGDAYITLRLNNDNLILIDVSQIKEMNRRFNGSSVVTMASDDMHHVKEDLPEIIKKLKKAYVSLNIPPRSWIVVNVTASSDIESKAIPMDQVESLYVNPSQNVNLIWKDRHTCSTSNSMDEIQRKLRDLGTTVVK